MRTLQQSLTEALMKMESVEQAAPIVAVSSLLGGSVANGKEWVRPLAREPLSRELPLKPFYPIQ